VKAAEWIGKIIAVLTIEVLLMISAAGVIEFVKLVVG
jgi:hypothetical protein